MKRFYVRKIDNCIDGVEHNHLKNVLRLKEGEQIQLFCGDDFFYTAEIIKIEKNQTLLKQVSKRECPANPKYNLTVYMALAKGEKLDLITQKLTELGATKLVPFVSQNCVKDKLKTERLNQIAISASKQCGRSTLMDITEVKTLKEILPNLKECLFANETEEHSTSGVLPLNVTSILIGPEGGFTAKEIEQIINAGAKSISLGKRILRAETAAIALASIIKHNQGEI